MRLATRRQWEVYGGALRFGGLLGAGFGLAVGAAVLKPPLLGAALGAFSGLVDATALMALVGGAEIFLPRTRLGRRLAQLPFLAVLAIKFAVYTAVILAVTGGQLGPRAVTLVVDPATAAAFREQVRASLPPGLLAAVAALTVLLVILLRLAVQIVGERTGEAIALGRYHRPRSEERFFLFIDIVGSTPVAERLGALSVHRYLNRIFQEASDPIDDHGGEVYQYVGDQIVVTWLVPEGRAAARPLACLFAIEAALANCAPEFERDFGTVPRLRAALHAGEVVTGESGGSRRAIVFHGDVMNTTSRIENLTRELGQPFLVSEDALARLEGAHAYALRDMGTQPLRGRQAPLRVYGVALRAGDAGQSSS
jgi:adenylate cyclase